MQAMDGESQSDLMLRDAKTDTKDCEMDSVTRLGDFWKSMWKK